MTREALGKKLPGNNFAGSTSTPELPRSPSQHNGMYRLKEYVDIQKQAVMFYVVKVVFKLLHGVLLAGAVRVANLGPSGNSGFDLVSQSVIRYVGQVLLYEFGPLRTGSNEAHIPT